MTLLATWLWQGLAIAGVTAALLRWQRRLGAATRHAIWWLALIAVAVLPLAYVADAAWREVETAKRPVIAGAVPLPAAPDWFTIALGAVWLAVALAGFIRIIYSVLAVRRLKRASTPFNERRAARLPMWRETSAKGRRAELRISPAVHGACALGFGKPVVLLSPALLQFEDRRLDAIVMHELAHIERRDDWLQLLQSFLSAACGFHPAVRMIGRRIEIEREAACDDMVVARGTEVREYARSLADVARTMARPRWKALAIPGAARSASVLRLRVRRLLDPVVARDGVAASSCVTCAVTMALAVGVSARTPVVVEFVDMAIGAPPAARLARMLPEGPRWLAMPEATAAPVALDAQIPVPTAVSLLPTGSRAGEPGGMAETRDAAPLLAPLPAIAPARSTQFTISQLEVPATSSSRLDTSRYGISRYEIPVVSGTSQMRPVTTPAASAARPWSSLARSAITAGLGAGRAGASVGRFFGRAGKAIGGSF